MSADLIAARREARRRKILENSERRLIKIAGKVESNHDIDTEHNEHKSNGSVKTHSSTKCENRLPNGLIRHEMHYNDEQEISYLPQREDFEQFTELLDDTSNFILSKTLKSNDVSSGERSNVQRVQQSSVYPKWLHHVLLIVFAAVTRILFALNLGFLCGESMLVPFIIVAVSFIITKYETMSVVPSGVLGATLLLSGISPHKLTALMTSFNIATALLQDFALYMFAFIVVHGIFIFVLSSSS